jgi:transposase
MSATSRDAWRLSGLPRAGRSQHRYRLAVLGASSFTYAQATWTQGLADWISGHVGAFEAIGGVPAPDNTKSRLLTVALGA